VKFSKITKISQQDINNILTSRITEGENCNLKTNLKQTQITIMVTSIYFSIGCCCKFYSF